MAARAALLLLPTALFLTSPVVFAQAAPPEVDQALRGRVTEFFQDFVDGKFRAAMNLVAEETQDEYLSNGKMEMKGFTIDAISYTDNFTKANVRLTVQQVLKLKAEGFLQDTTVAAPMDTAWKIENGKWVWFNAPKSSGWLTPMGPSADVRATGGVDRPQKINDATMLEQAQRILHQADAATGLTPQEVTLDPSRPSTEKLVFHNGASGSLSLSIVGLPNNFPGFTAKVDKLNVNAGEDATVEVHYEPTSGQPPPGGTIVIAVDVEPFSNLFPFQVTFGPKQ